MIAAEPSVTATVVPEGTTLGLNGGADLPGGIYVNFPPTAVALPVHVSVSVSNEAPERRGSAQRHYLAALDHQHLHGTSPHPRRADDY